MQVSRKAAANVFIEQNLRQQDEEEVATEYDADDIYAASPALAEAFDQLQAVNNMPVGGAYAPMQVQGALSSVAKPRAAKEKKLVMQEGLKTSEELQLEKEPVKVREINFLFWKRVIVPPNVYVVQTRMGRAEPVTIGLGCSFQMNPTTDTYLVVPAAMQTIGVVANCISKEKQGINVLAYVQWQISDFSIAYRKLDFSDSRDPLGIVNAQLREQAEAAIKDKVATMSVEEVLTDKAPVIEELTTRLKSVAEGRNQEANAAGANEGLGIKIVTVQIKEALVSSQRLWESLQAPFRHEQAKKARISFLLAQDEIRKKELETRELSETSEAETLVAIERIKQSKQTEALELRLTEENTRFNKEQEVARQKLQLEEQTTRLKREIEQRQQLEADQAAQELQLAQLRREQEAALEEVRLRSQSEAQQKALETDQALQIMSEENRLAVAALQNQREEMERKTQIATIESAYTLLTQEQYDRLQAQSLEATLQRQMLERQTLLELDDKANLTKIAQLTREIEINREQQKVRNLVSRDDLVARLIERLPELASHMPKIHEYKVIQTGADGAFDALTGFLTKTMALAGHLGLELGKDKETVTQPDTEK